MKKNKTILVCLVSEQTIPNVQFIKWYFSQNQKEIEILFISTEEMERKEKTKHIENTLVSFRDSFEIDVITTDENDMDKVLESLRCYFLEKQFEDIIVNITGGTKLMSLAAYQFFIQLENAKIFYQPIGKPLQQLYPETTKYDIFEILSLEEFLTAHGISFSFDNNCVKDWDFNKTVFDLIIKDNHTLIKKMVVLQNNSWFKNIWKRKDSLNFEEISEEKFSNIGGISVTRDEMCGLIALFGFNPQDVKLSHIRYITGGWFEEYVYQKICNEEDNVEEKNVALNVNISKGNDKNELDIIYLDRDNKLHVIECKSFVEGKEGGKVLNDALYKLQAIIKSKFGLFVKQHLYTKSIIEKETPLTRAREFGIDIKDGSEI